MRPVNPTAAAAAVAAVAAAAAWRLYPFSTTTTTSHRGGHSPATSVVPVVELSPSEQLDAAVYARLAAARQPTVLRGTVIERWAAFQWTAAEVAERLPWVEVYSQPSSNPSFTTFHDGKPLEPELTTKRRHHYNTLKNVSTVDVLGGSDGRQWLYFSSDVTRLAERWPEIETSLHPMQPLFVDATGVQVNLWLGRRGITTATHFDASWNFFAQLRGHKRFTLVPPNGTALLRPYSCLHPHIGHAQVDLAQVAPAQWDGVTGWQPLEVELGRGDLLVVPPFWWHKVETLTDGAVAVNAWSDDPSYSLLEEVYTLPIPLEPFWGFEEMVVATKALIGLLVRGLGGRVAPPWPAGSPGAGPGVVEAGMVKRLVQARWTQLVASGELIPRNQTLTAKIGRICARGAQPPLPTARKLEHGLVAPLGLLRRIRADVVELALGNYIEHVCMLALGLESVYPFLNQCFV